MYDINRVIKEFKEACEKAGVVCDTPIILNGRLSRTLGQVCYDINDKPTSIEFSKKFLETATDNSIHETLLHEAAHYIVGKRTGKSHGHDAIFKACCAEIGCTADAASTKVERIKGASAAYKYTVMCPNCGEVGHYSRMCSTLKQIKYCSCGKCKSTGLTYKQNW